MKPSPKMREKEHYMEQIGYKAFEWTQVHTLMARNGSICKIDRSGRVRYLRKDEIDELAKIKGA